MKKILIILSVFSLYSCGSSPSERSKTENPEAKIADNYWILESIRGEFITQPDDSHSKIGFQLDSQEKRISGFAGCNRFTGSYNQSGEKLSFSQMGATKMACLTSTFNENDFLRIFESVDNYKIKNGKLKLLNGNEELAELSVESQPESDIEEKYWKLKTLRNQKVEMEENQEQEIYFTLKRNAHRVNGFAGCNTFSGEYKLSGDSKIEFARMITTLRICPHLKLNDSDFTSVLHEADNYEIKDDELNLKKGNTVLATFEAVYL